MIVLDASAVLAAMRGEPGDSTVLRHAHGAALSAVNLSEVIARLASEGVAAEQAAADVSRLRLELVPFGERQAVRAGALRPLTAHLGLSLGDRACLALAEQLEATVLTADRRWAELDLGIEIRLIR